MKLYTETEVKKMLEDTWAFNTATVQELLEDMPHVEFPSDEQIDDRTYWHGLYKAGFFDGAKWMRDKISKL